MSLLLRVERDRRDPALGYEVAEHVGVRVCSCVCVCVRVCGRVRYTCMCKCVLEVDPLCVCGQVGQTHSVCVGGGVRAWSVCDGSGSQ